MPVPRINTYVIILAPVQGNLGGVIKSCLARVKQYVKSVERQRDIMTVGKQELFDLIVFGAVRGLDGHDHRTVHHHVNIRWEAKKKKNKEGGENKWCSGPLSLNLVKQLGFAGTWNLSSLHSSNVLASKRGLIFFVTDILN